MKVVLAGAYGNLGSDIFRELLKNGHEVVALGRIERDLNLNGNYSFKQVDVTKPESPKRSKGCWQRACCQARSSMAF